MSLHTIEELRKERSKYMHMLKWCEDGEKEINILITIDSIDRAIINLAKEIDNALES